MVRRFFLNFGPELLVGMVSFVLGVTIVGFIIFRFITGIDTPPLFLQTLIFFAGLGTCLAGSIFLPRKFRTNVQIVILSSLIGLFIINAILLTIEMLRPPLSKYDVVMQLRENDPAVIPAPFPNAAFSLPAIRKNFDQGGMRPVSGVAGVTNVFCREAGPMVVYMSDRFGFRNDDDAYENGELDVVLIGDSFAQGSCVTSDVASRLRDTGLRAITLGMAGNGPLLELAALREFGPIIRPKHVVWMFYENDFGNLDAELRDPILSRYLADENYTQRLAARQNLVDAMWIEGLREIEATASKSSIRDAPYYRWMLRRFLTLGRLRELTGRAGFVEHDFERRPNSATLKSLHEVLAAAKSASEKIGARLIIVLLPSPLDALKKTVHAAKYIEPILADLGIETIPFPEAVFDVSRPKFLFSDGYASGHYNDEGYALLAGIVGKYVRSH